MARTHSLNAAGVLAAFHLIGRSVPIIFLLHQDNYPDFQAQSFVGKHKKVLNRVPPDLTAELPK